MWVNELLKYDKRNGIWQRQEDTHKRNNAVNWENNEMEEVPDGESSYEASFIEP